MAGSTRKLIVRQATLADIPAVQAMVRKAYPAFEPYSADQLRGHINHFPEGTLLAEYEGQVVGYCVSIRIGEQALRPHTWREITGGGYGSTHEADGEYLYGCEVCVDPDYRGLHIGQRLYSARRKLCVDLHLKGIVFGGRIPGFKRRARDVGSAEEYVRRVSARELRDPVMTFQMRNGFEPIGVLKNYVPSDQASMGYATHMLWKNPAKQAHTHTSSSPSRRASTVRVATVQYLQRRISSFDEFAQIVSYFVSAVAENKSDFVLFPELFTMQLLSLADDNLKPLQSMRQLATYTERYKQLFESLAIRHNINIIAGSHPTDLGERGLQNIAYVFLRDGSVHMQPKIHPTPDERYWWQIQGGDTVSSIETDCGPIGVLVCYDSEFPELARHLIADQGANILFVPFSTEVRQGYLRVRYCAQARAVENQCYVVTSGNVGNLPRVQNMDLHYAQSCILTPCDFPFARDGIAADTTPNVEMIAFADLDLDTLESARAAGSVQNLKDRRHDLYSVVWTGPGSTTTGRPPS
jgi:predicted amidohydrolase/GNAT superfamily N-acetyltransferase